MLKTMTLRLRGAKAELESAGLDTDNMANSVSNLREQIKSLTGFDIMENATTFKPIYEQLSGIANAIKEMDPASTNVMALLELLTGKRGANIGLSMLQNWDMVASATKTAEESAGSADKEYNRWLQSLEGHISVVESKFQNMSQNLLKSGLLKLVMDLTGSFIDLSDKVGALTPLLTVLGTVFFNKSGRGLTLGLDSTGKFSGSFFGNLKPRRFERIQNQINELTGNTGYGDDAWTRAGWTGRVYTPAQYNGTPTPFSNMILANEAMKEFKVNTLGIPIGSPVDMTGLNDDQRERYLQLQDAINTTTAAYKEQTLAVADGNKVAVAYGENLSIEKQQLTNLTGKTVGLTIKTFALSAAQSILNAAMSFGIGLAISAAVEGITSLAKQYDQALEDTTENIEQFKQALNDIETARKFAFTSSGSNTEDIEKFVRLRKQINTFDNTNISLTSDELEEYYSLANKIAELLPDFVSGWDKNNNAILKNVDSVDQYREALKKAENQAKQTLLQNDKSEGESKSQKALDGGEFDDAYEDYKAADLMADLFESGKLKEYYRTRGIRDISDIVSLGKKTSIGEVAVEYLQSSNTPSGIESNIYGYDDFVDVYEKALQQAGLDKYSDWYSLTDDDIDKLVESLKNITSSFKTNADTIAKQRAEILKAQRFIATDGYTKSYATDDGKDIKFNEQTINLLDSLYASLDSDFFHDDKGELLTEERQINKIEEIEKALDEVIKSGENDKYQKIYTNKNAKALEFKNAQEEVWKKIKDLKIDEKSKKAVGISLGLDIVIDADGKAKFTNSLDSLLARLRKSINDSSEKWGISSQLLDDLGNLPQGTITDILSASDSIFEEIPMWLETHKGDKNLADAFSDYISSAAEVSQISDTAKQNIAEQIKGISSYSDVAGSILKEQSEKGGISSDSVVKLYDAFKELNGFDISNFVVETSNGFSLVSNASTMLKEIILSNSKSELSTLQNHAIKLLNIQDVEATGTEEATNRIIESYKLRMKAMNPNSPNYKNASKIIEELQNKQKSISDTEPIINKLFDEAINGSATDKAMKQWDNFYSSLQHKRSMNQISEQQYYSQLYKGMNKYLSGDNENVVKERRQIQEQIHDYEKQAWDRALALQQNNLDTGKISNSQYYRWIIRNADKYLQTIKGDTEKEYAIKKASYEAQKALDDQYYEYRQNRYDGVLKGVESLFDDEIKSLNKTKDSIKKAYDEEIEAISDKIEVMDKENEQRQRALDLAKAEEDLAKAQRNRSRRVYKAGVGFVYEQDQNAIADAQKELSEARTNKAKGELEDEKKLLQKQSDASMEYYDDMIDSLNEYKSAWSDIPKEFEKATNQMALSAVLGVNSVIDVLKGGGDLLKQFKGVYDSLEIDKLRNSLKYGDETYTDIDIDNISYWAKKLGIDTSSIGILGNTVQQSANNMKSMLSNGNKIPSTIQLNIGDIVIKQPVGDGKSLADAILTHFPNYLTQQITKQY